MTGRDLFAVNKGRDLFAGQEIKSIPETSALGAVTGFAGGVVKSALETGQSITSLFGLAPNPVSESLGQTAQDIQRTSADKGIPLSSVQSGQNIADVATIATPIGGAVGGVLSTLGKTNRALKFLNEGGKVKRAIGKTLTEAAKDPAKTIKLEAAIAGASAATGQAVKEKTDSSLLAFGAEFLTGGFLSRKASELRYGLSLVNEDTITKTLAERFRRDPELLARTEQNVAEMSKEGLKVRLDLATKDKDFIGAVDMLRTKGTDNIREQVDGIINETNQALEASAVLSTGKAISPIQAEEIVQRTKDAYANRIDETLKGLDGIADAGTKQEVGSNALKIMEKVKSDAEREAHRQFDAIAPGELLPPEANAIIKAALKKADSTPAVDKKFVIGQIAPDVRAIRNELKKPDASGILGPTGKPIPAPPKLISVDGINAVRGTILGRAKKLAESPDGKDAARRLNILAESIQDAIDTTPNQQLKDVNKLWREIKTTFDEGEMALFMKNPSSFVTKFLTGANAKEASEKLIALAERTDGPLAGVTPSQVTTLARDGFLSILKASVPEGEAITSRAIGRFISQNKELLDTHGLTPEFRDVGKVAREVNDLKIEQPALDRLTLAKFGTSENPATLRNSLRTGAFEAQMKALPKKVRPAFKRTLLKAAIHDDDGKLLPARRLSSILNTHAAGLADNSAHAKRLKALADIINAPDSSKTFDTFSKFFKGKDLKERLQSVALDRLARTFRKLIGFAGAAKDFLRNQKAQERMVELFLTEKGSREVLDLAAKVPASKSFIRALVLARATATPEE